MEFDKGVCSFCFSSYSSVTVSQLWQGIPLPRHSSGSGGPVCGNVPLSSCGQHCTEPQNRHPHILPAVSSISCLANSRPKLAWLTHSAPYTHMHTTFEYYMHCVRVVCAYTYALWIATKLWALLCSLLIFVLYFWLHCFEICVHAEIKGGEGGM